MTKKFKKTIIINKEVLQDYFDYYFNEYPKRRVEPVKLFPPSMNTFMTLQRMSANAMKGKYKEYAKWMASYFNIAELKLGDAIIIYEFWFGDRRRRDIDNLMITPKFLNDGFVDAGVFVDDSSEHLGLRIERTNYDKENPRIEITIMEI